MLMNVVTDLGRPCDDTQLETVKPKSHVFRPKKCHFCTVNVRVSSFTVNLKQETHVFQQ